MHSLLKQQGVLPQEWKLSQCLFGEHLLTRYPAKPVALVESENTATPEERAVHIDIADLLIRWIQEQPLPCPPASENPVFLEVKKYISPEYHAEVLALIEELGLELVGVMGQL